MPQGADGRYRYRPREVIWSDVSRELERLDSRVMYRVVHALKKGREAALSLDHRWVGVRDPSLTARYRRGNLAALAQHS